MKKVATHRKNRTIRAAAVLLILVLLSTMGVGMSVARNTTGSFAEDEARTAAFVFNVVEEKAKFVIPITDFVPGVTKEYNLTVTNYRNGYICETDQKYTITVELEGSLPLVCTLTKENRKVDDQDVPVNSSETVSLDALTMQSNPSEMTFDTNTVFEASVAYEDTYCLNVKWPDEAVRKDPKYAGGVAEVEIDMVSVQID